ncbi:MAG: GspH/FimT family pseudopilin [Methylococcaceae bacterium]
MLKQKRQRGFTLTEMMITIAIVAILAGLAVPSFTSTLERRKIIGVAEAILSDLRWARGEAIKRNTDVTVTFTPGAAGDWSYTVDPGAKTVDSSAIPEYSDIALAENFGSDNTIFDHIRGTAQAGAVTLTSSANNYQLRVVLTTMGRARICSVGGTVGGYDAC